MKDIRVIRILFSLFLFLQIPIIGHAGDEELNNSLILEAKAGNAEMVQYWLDQGADPNSKIQSGQHAGRSILYIAARAGHIECVEILLSAGADVNSKDPYYEETPLDVAIRKKHHKIVQILKETGDKE
jgi:ankyrin repeat protein